jgi:hypothetical protein
MKQILYALWAVMLLGALGLGWKAVELFLNTTPSAEVKSQIQHVDDWVNNRGVYGQR